MNHQLIATNTTVPKEMWDDTALGLEMSAGNIIRADMEYGTVCCITNNEQVLLIQVSPDYLEQPTIKVTLITKES